MANVSREEIDALNKRLNEVERHVGATGYLVAHTIAHNANVSPEAEGSKAIVLNYHFPYGYKIDPKTGHAVALLPNEPRDPKEV